MHMDSTQQQVDRSYFAPRLPPSRGLENPRRATRASVLVPTFLFPLWLRRSVFGATAATTNAIAMFSTKNYIYKQKKKSFLSCEVLLSGRAYTEA